MFFFSYFFPCVGSSAHITLLSSEPATSEPLQRRSQAGKYHF